MGCSSTREKIEDQMLQIKMLRMEIQMERENNINQLQEMENRKITHPDIPDYIDPKFALQKKIYYINKTELVNNLPKEEEKAITTKNPKKTKKVKTKGKK